MWCNTEQAPVAPPPPPPRCPPPKFPPVQSGTERLESAVTQQRDDNDYIEPQMLVDNMFDDVLGSLDGKVCWYDYAVYSQQISEWLVMSLTMLCWSNDTYQQLDNKVLRSQPASMRKWELSCHDIVTGLLYTVIFWLSHCKLRFRVIIYLQQICIQQLTEASLV